MRAKLLFAALIVALAVSSFLPRATPVSLAATTVASQTAASNCDPGGVIAKANKLQTSGDPQADMKTLLNLVSDITTMSLVCNGMSFKAYGDKVVGPIMPKPALYKVHVRTKFAFALSFRTMTGSDCKSDQSARLLDEVSLANDNVIDAETTWSVSVYCRMVLQISNSNFDWTLDFTPIQ